MVKTQLNEKGEEVPIDSLGVPLKEGYVLTTGFTALSHPKNADTLRKLLQTTILMAIFPLATFLYVRNYAIPNMDIDVGRHRDMISFGCAVVVAYLIIGFYAYSAFNEPDDDEEDLDSKIGHPRLDPKVKKTQ